ncbi:peptide/nickel transport system substrate-binding protein [Psychromicrobium silvestre]|uniref:Peptide/nickel transport system substrate-binding protein n=1 Tax=Psychromicrobium silvestre TaxID=1645614 RepID=A0A7Y9S857_9MICC|nr:ABC transporter family substrate-binding protein [Psychromicrobium silvestre]NYE95092.1 peptide/nickel transport system substrate-binding protein [Psychromicrobium silvestre]
MPTVSPDLVAAPRPKARVRFGHIAKILGAIVVAALVLTACDATSDQQASNAASQLQGGTATVAEANSFTSFNPDTAHGNIDINSKISYATHSGFGYLDDSLNIVHNDKFGKVEKVSDSPLTVKYTVNSAVKWSDDAPVDANDLILAWVISSGYFNDSSGAKGTTYFAFARDTSVLALSDFPDVSSDGRSITVKYSQPVADWEIALGFPTITTPAHVLAQKSGLKDAAALTALFKSLPRGNPKAPVTPNVELKKVSDFWNTGFDTQSMPTDPSLLLSNGPYVVKSIEPGKSMTLVRNRDYNWGPEAHLDQINVSYLPDASTQISALKDGSADIIVPAASANAINQIQSLAGKGVSMETGEQLSYEHLDLDFSGVFADKNVRLAFLKTVPRQDIVNKIIKQLNPDAKPLDSQLFVPAQSKYADAVKANGSTEFAAPDIEGAKALLKGATPEVRILFDRNNPSRQDIFKLIASSAAKAGFRIVDASPAGDDWSKSLGGSSYDAAIFGWSNQGIGVSDVPQIFKTGGATNFNDFSDPKVDSLMKELITTSDSGKQAELKVQIDTLIWDAAYGLPLFQWIGLDAYGSKVTGIRYNPTQLGAWWNVWDWVSRAG